MTPWTHDVAHSAACCLSACTALAHALASLAPCFSTPGACIPLAKQDGEAWRRRRVLPHGGGAVERGVSVARAWRRLLPPPPQSPGCRRTTGTAPWQRLRKALACVAQMARRLRELTRVPSSGLHLAAVLVRTWRGGGGKGAGTVEHVVGVVQGPLPGRLVSLPRPATTAVALPHARPNSPRPHLAGSAASGTAHPLLSTSGSRPARQRAGPETRDPPLRILAASGSRARAAGGGGLTDGLQRLQVLRAGDGDAVADRPGHCA